MENLKAKEMISAGLIGLSGFVAPLSLICIICYFTDLAKSPYPLKYLVPTFIISLAVLLYCFYVLGSISKYRKQNNLESI
jgi:hypothetical protein